ncbi:MAG: hypothetical protein COV47_03930 [Candidatus Diapherotrites archaeon CG11_big_fil_rev_8_21_14_0_20_37_9]|nr:MAG: hypothetical protein COV47_03930 [Candidatus Diapherotrites archaeon CG11_big_fil_rev_8_21_14_0_20_37_9]
MSSEGKRWDKLAKNYLQGHLFKEYMRKPNILRSIGKVKHLPRLICCNQDTCSPMVNAFDENSPVLRDKDLVKDPKGICRSILRGTPGDIYMGLYKFIKETRGGFEKTGLKSIIESAKEVNDLEGLDAGYSSAIALACVKRIAKQGKIKKDDEVLVNLTDGRYTNKPTKTTWKYFNPLTIYS